MNPLVFNENVYRLHPDYKEYSLCLKTVHDFTDEMIRVKRKVKKDRASENRPSTINNGDKIIGMKNRSAFLDHIIEFSDDGKALSDTDIREEVLFCCWKISQKYNHFNSLQVDTITFAGHDTTAASIFYTLYMLASHPNCMARVEDEIFGIFDDVERPITMEDLTNLKYLECCIKETMRICPSVTFISRECDEDVLIEVRHILHFNFGPRPFARPSRITSFRQAPKLSSSSTVSIAIQPTSLIPIDLTLTASRQRMPPREVPTPTSPFPPAREIVSARNSRQWSRRSCSRAS